MTIIASSRARTSQATPVSREKKASSVVITPVTSTTAAPPRAAATRWTRSVASRT